MKIRYTYNREEARYWVRELSGNIIGFDIETYGKNGLDPYQSATRLAQFYDGGEYATVIDIAHTGMLPEIQELMADESRMKIIHNAGFEYKHWLHQYDIKIKNPFCTMVGHQVLTAGRFTQGASLEGVIGYYYNIPVDKALQKADWGDTLTEEHIRYAGFDPILNIWAFNAQMQILNSLSDKERDHTKKVLQLEMGILPLCSQMELEGLYYDKVQLERLEPIFRDEMETHLRKAQATLPTLDLNLLRPEPGKSNKWWTKTLKPTKLHRERYPDGVKPPETADEFMTIYKAIGVEVPKLQKTGKESLSADTYGKLQHPSGQHLQHYGSAKTIYSTFVKKALENWWNPITGKVHPGINQTGTVTGRMSMSAPNFQNIPKKESRFRPLLYAPDGWSIVKADYSQMELRVMAQVSSDENLIQAFKQGWDVHAMTAANIYHRSVEDYLTGFKAERNVAKSVNFGSIYGQQAVGLRQYLFTNVGLDFSVEECQHFLNAFFTTYPGIKNYHEMMERHVVEYALAHGGNYHTATLYGRIRYWEELKMYARKARGHAGTSYFVRMNDILNLPVQGTAGDIIKLVMLKLFKDGILTPYVRLLLQVHDELVFLVKDEAVADFIPILKYIMISEAENLLTDVPVDVEIKTGRNWAGEPKAA